jgi:hypothetical protein
MRSTLIILAAFVLGGPAVAQTWEEYSYPDFAFLRRLLSQTDSREQDLPDCRQPLRPSARLFGPAEQQRIEGNHRRPCEHRPR